MASACRTALEIQRRRRTQRYDKEHDNHRSIPIKLLPRIDPPRHGRPRQIVSSNCALAHEKNARGGGGEACEGGSRLWQMLTPRAEAAYPLAGWSNVSRVACDDMSGRKWHNDVSVFCDLRADAKE